MLQVAFDQGPDYVKRWGRFVLRTRRLGPLELLAVVAGSLVLCDSVLEGDSEAIVFGTLSAMSFAVVCVFYSTARRRVYGRLPPTSHTLTIRFETSGIVWTRGGEYSRVLWGEFLGVHETEDDLFLELSLGRAVVVPRRAVEDDEAWQELISEVRRLYDEAAATTTGPLLRDTRVQ